MAEVKLSFGCGWYDRIEPLRNKTVVPEGIDLEIETIEDPRLLFDRLSGKGDFDLAELSMSEYVAMTAAGTSPYMALPVWTSRAFRHSFICINTHAGIKSPKDLEGRRIGVPLHTMSAAIWCRGALRDDYGVDLSKVTWVEGAMEHAGLHGTAREHHLAVPTTITHNSSPYSLSELLDRGEIDATLGALMPTNFGTSKNIERLFPNYRAVEIASYQKTGVHPIMHLVVIRKSALEKHRWIVEPLMEAFRKAKDLAMARLFYTGALRSMLPMLHAEVDETRRIFGDDPWPDGVEKNLRTLDRLITYMMDDGIITRRPSYDELFLTT
jgi:4,5-dihydroxyphthalate decarboxylase